MDILIKIIDKKTNENNEEIIKIDESITNINNIEQSNDIYKNKKLLVKVFMGITILFIFSTLVCNGFILFVRHKLNLQQSIYGISNKLYVKLCFIVSSVLLLILIALMTFLYPFYNSYKNISKC